MRLIVTRPRHEAEQWVAQLQRLNFNAVALPLIQIDATTDNISGTSYNKCIGSISARTAWENLPQQPNHYRAVMFVSGNAVRYFFSNAQEVSNFVERLATNNIANNRIKTRFWATGRGTQQALLEVGIPAEMIDAPATDAQQFDSEALWDCVKKQMTAGDKVLIVRGSSPDSKDAQGIPMNGRPWLAQQLTAVGVQVETVVSYQRRLPDFDSAQLALIEAASTDGSVWLFSSSEAVANLRSIHRSRHGSIHSSIHSRPADGRAVALDWSKASAITTHPRIAQAARTAGFAVVYESRPLLRDVAERAASIESML